MLPYILRTTSNDFPLIDPGQHLAYLWMIVLFGVQSTPYGERRQVRFQWLLEGKTRTWTDRAGNKCTAPLSIGRTFTETIDARGALRPMVEGMLGRLLTKEEEKRGYNIWSLAGLPCLVHATHKQGSERPYAVVSAVSPAPPGMTPKPLNECVLYGPDQSDERVFAQLPKWIQEVIRKRIRTESPQKIAADPDTGAASAPEFNDAIPF